MDWPKDIESAKIIQKILRKKIRIFPLKKEPEYVAGVDAAFFRNIAIGVACLYRYPDLTFIEETTSITKVLFPYIPSFLSFREGEAIINAISKLKKKPDMILFDGQGIAHPEGMGIATHIGILLGIPTIGCAKSRLIGDYQEPGYQKGSWSFLKYKGKIVGAVLRTRESVKPLFVSPGHMTDLKNSIEITLNCSKNYRIPEPLRRADLISKKGKRSLAYIIHKILGRCSF
ncbi:MAG: endonuclease V [Thermodesulfovibrionales bacterium]